MEGHGPYPNADTGATNYLQLAGQNLDKKFRADIADTGVSSTRWKLAAPDISSSRKNTQATLRTKEVNLASTRHRRGSRGSLDIMLQPRDAVCCKRNCIY
jgi:hypothetical protein